MSDQQLTMDDWEQRVGDNADGQWIKAAEAVILAMEPGHSFCADDIWNVLADSDHWTHEPRALGAVVRELRRAGVIESTGTYRKSTRPEAHQRPVAVWRRLA